MRSLPLLVLGVLVCDGHPAAAQLVIGPSAMTTSTSTSGNSAPFGQAQVRYQQIHSLADLITGGMPASGGVIQSLEWRPAHSFIAHTFSIELRLATAATAWNSYSRTFASNLGPDQTLVFSGTWHAPQVNQAGAPRPFAWCLPLQTPFAFGASGDLVWDVKITANSTTSAIGSDPQAQPNGSPDPSTYFVSRLYDRTNAQASTAPWSSTGYGVTTRFNFGTATQRLYGVGCAGTAGTPGIGAALPHLGNAAFHIGLINGPPGDLGFLFFGLSDVVWSGIGLPLDLTPAGLPGCFLYQSMDVSLGQVVTNARGAATVYFALPNDPSIAGAVVFGQWIARDPSAAPVPLILSNALALVFG